MAERELTNLLMRARDAQARGDLATAEKLFADALRAGADAYADVHHSLGIIYHSWNLYSKARTAFEAALRLNPKYTEAALNLAITYNDLGRYTEAEALMSSAASTKASGMDELTRSKIANLHAELGRAYRSAGLPVEAAIEYRRALGLCPRYIDIRADLASALADAGERKEAIEQLQLVLVENPDYVPAMLQIALLYHGEGDTTAAYKALMAVLDRHAGHERALAYLRMLEHGDKSD